MQNSLMQYNGGDVLNQQMKKKKLSGMSLQRLDQNSMIDKNH